MRLGLAAFALLAVLGSSVRAGDPPPVARAAPAAVDLDAVMHAATPLVGDPAWTLKNEPLDRARMDELAAALPSDRGAALRTGFVDGRNLVAEMGDASVDVLAVLFDDEAHATSHMSVHRKMAEEAVTPAALAKTPATLEDGAGLHGGLPGFVLAERFADKSVLVQHAARLGRLILRFDINDVPELDRPTVDSVFERVRDLVERRITPDAFPAPTIPSHARTLTLRVVGAKGEPVPAASVAWRERERTDWRLAPAKNGAAILRTAKRALLVTVFAARDATGAALGLAPRTLLPVAETATAVDARLDPGVTIEGTVVDASGAPVANSVVEVGAVEEGKPLVLPDEPWLHGRVVSAADGSFRFVGMGPILYVLAARGGVPAGRSEPIAVRGGDRGVRVVVSRPR